MLNKTLFTAACVNTALFGGNALASSIGVNVTTRPGFGGWIYHGSIGWPAADTAKEAGYVNQGNWNNLPRDIDKSGGTAYSLIDDSGADSGADVVINANFDYFTFNNVDNGPSGSNGLDFTERNNLRLMNSFVGYNSGNSGSLFTVTDVPYGYYDVLVYATNDGTNRQASVEVDDTTFYYTTERSFDAEARLIAGDSAWNLGTNTDSGLFPLANVLEFKGLTDSDLVIDHAAISGNSGISGFQIVERDTSSITLQVAQDGWIDEFNGVQEGGVGDDIRTATPNPAGAFQYTRKGYFGFDLSDFAALGIDPSLITDVKFNASTDGDVSGSYAGAEVLFTAVTDGIDIFDETTLQASNAPGNPGGNPLTNPIDGTVIGSFVAPGSPANSPVLLRGPDLLNVLRNDTNNFLTIVAVNQQQNNAGYGPGTGLDFFSKESGRGATLTIEFIPEPASLAVGMVGLGGLALRRRRR